MFEENNMSTHKPSYTNQKFFSDGQGVSASTCVVEKHLDSGWYWCFCKCHKLTKKRKQELWDESYT